MSVITQRDAAGAVEVVASGELDLSTVARFETELQNAVAEAAGQKIAVDLRGVEYLDSAAINVLFGHAQQLSRVRVHPLVLRGLTISGLDQVVTVEAGPA